MKINFNAIKNKKNLLAFSAGVDSTALFFLLQKESIPFDIAIVNYNERIQSIEEINYAKTLALKFNKKIFIKTCKIENKSNFEKKARDIRYSFFEQIIKENSYDLLITAHQLNDKLEWFLMQLSKGAGLSELIGLNQFEDKNSYKIYKPLLKETKESLEIFLKENKIKYFIDSTNFETKYKRNYFRKKYANELLKEFKNGIKNSFEYLEEDLKLLHNDKKAIKNIKELEIFENLNNNNLNIRIIDKSLKKRGILLSKATRVEIIKQKDIIISKKIAISIQEEFIYIAPVSNISMDKKYKELCRIYKIPKNIRPYIFCEKINPEDLII